MHDITIHGNHKKHTKCHTDTGLKYNNTCTHTHSLACCTLTTVVTCTSERTVIASTAAWVYWVWRHVPSVVQDKAKPLRFLKLEHFDLNKYEFCMRIIFVQQPPKWQYNFAVKCQYAWVVRCWHGYLSAVWSEVQTCIWPSWCHCHSLSLASVKSRLVLPFWYWLTRVVPDKGPLNGCVCLCQYAIPDCTSKVQVQ